jgi:hypothetical protein
MEQGEEGREDGRRSGYSGRRTVRAISNFELFASTAMMRVAPAI